MSENLEENLKNYKVQLSQIDDLLSSADCQKAEETLKLKQDLLEIIALTESLLKQNEERVPRMLAKYAGVGPAKPRKRGWKAGDSCMAYLSKANCYKVGTIKEIIDEKSCCVAFPGKYKEIVQLDSLKKTNVNLKMERQKVKKEKYEEKTKLRNQIAEESKQTWTSFLNKKSSKGTVKKSIFSTPDTVHGRVGIGTCGTGGQPMTVNSCMKKPTKGSY